jgi:flavodoxin
MSRILVIYFSRAGQNYLSGSLVDLEKGNAAVLAEYIQEATDADMHEIRTVRPYPESYNECTAAAKKELRDNARPRLKEMLHDIDKYEVVFIVGPCWWGTYPMPVFTQIEALRWTGKKVVPVMTHEGSGLGSSEKDLKRLCKGARVVKGLAIQGARVPDVKEEVGTWARRNLKW